MLLQKVEYFNLEGTINYKVIISLVLFLLAIIFMVQNLDVVEIHFLFWNLAMSLSLLIFLLFIIGAIAGWLLVSLRSHSKSKTAEMI